MAQAAPAPQRTHSFAKKTFHKPTYCHHCSDLLWGLIGQGYGCEGTRAHAPRASRYADTRHQHHQRYATVPRRTRPAATRPPPGRRSAAARPPPPRRVPTETPVTNLSIHS